MGIEINDPNLEKFINSLNKPIYDRIEELKFINGINGDKRPVKDVVRDTHRDLKIVCADMAEVKENTKFLTKSKIIWTIILFLISQMFLFGVWKGTVDTTMDNVKELLLDIKQDAHTNQEDIKELLKRK